MCTDLDMDARYSVAHYPGVAFYLRGYATEQVEREDSWTDDESGETFYSYEYETEEDPTRVRAVMVGDDREHIIDVEDLAVIDDLDYCAECGQIGCAHDGRDREAI